MVKIQMSNLILRNSTVNFTYLHLCSYLNIANFNVTIGAIQIQKGKAYLINYK